MKNKIQQITEKKLIIQSSDNKSIYGKHYIQINNTINFSFEYDELIPLSIVENNIDKITFTFIINHCQELKKNNTIPELASYKNAENLPVFFKKTSNYYIIISFGEYQPSLYRIYIEGVFLITPSIQF